MHSHQWGAWVSPTAPSDLRVSGDIGTILMSHVLLGSLMGTQDTSCLEASALAEAGTGTWHAD